MPFCAALASGLPLLIGAYFDHLDYGLVSSLGGLVFLYTPGMPMSHRMVSLMAAVFGMSACFALGLMSHFLPVLLVPVLSFIAILVTMVCRFYVVGPPGSLFFIMAAAIGAYSPIAMLRARLLDTVLGSLVGLVGGVCLHSPRFRELLGRQLRRLSPSRLLP